LARKNLSQPGGTGPISSISLPKGGGEIRRIGKHDRDSPQPNDDKELDQYEEKKSKRLCRHDPFSSYRAGFEVRAYLLCQRILIFHHFPDEQGVRRHRVAGIANLAIIR
jgi:hypothetical protein